MSGKRKKTRIETSVAPRILCPPSLLGPDTVGRVVLRDGWAISEIWDGERWVKGAIVAAVEEAPPASPAALARLGIPVNEEDTC